MNRFLWLSIRFNRDFSFAVCTLITDHDHVINIRLPLNLSTYRIEPLEREKRELGVEDCQGPVCFKNRVIEIEKLSLSICIDRCIMFKWQTTKLVSYFCHNEIGQILAQLLLGGGRVLQLFGDLSPKYCKNAKERAKWNEKQKIGVQTCKNKEKGLFKASFGQKQENCWGRGRLKIGSGRVYHPPPLVPRYDVWIP